MIGNKQKADSPGINRRFWNFYKIITYEVKILSFETVLVVLIGLLLVSIALITASKGTMPFTAWIFFEVLIPLATMFLVISILSRDRVLRILERIYTLQVKGAFIYLRRLGIVCALEVGIISFLGLIWQIKEGAPSFPKIIITSCPPMLFLSCLAFLGAVFMNNANSGGVIAGSWWFINQVLKRYGDTGFFGYIFLFKETYKEIYYPDSTTILANKITLLIGSIVLVIVIYLLLRRAERFL